MSEPGFASLGPTLLARKGGAKPAMRPQVAPLVADQAAVPEEQLEDLGWNDMGHEERGHDESGAKIVPINADIAADEFTANPGPVVRRQQRRLEERVLADAVMTGPEDFGDEDHDEEEGPVYGEAWLDGDYADEAEEQEQAYAPAPIPAPLPAPVAALVATPARQPAPAPVAAASARRAAFTLRLDADRHLKLRLAATMQGVSAQALVTEALDRLLAEYDDLDVIANHLKRH
jgi:hypothetical protein